MSEKHYIGLDLTGFEDNGEARPVSRVTLLTDGENAFTAGDGSGTELTAECPCATQEMADALLKRLKGYTYKMIAASGAGIDPEAELGDGITAGGVYTFISGMESGDSGYPDLEAAGRAELEDEFPTEGPVTRALDRRIASTRAAITKTAEDISLLVENTAEGLRATVQQTAADIRAEVKDTADGLSSSITQNAGAIEERVTKNGVIAAINLSSEEASIRAGKISLEGLVTVNGSFQIDGDGYLRCSGGTVGGFTIGASALYNGLPSLGGTADGVYVGTDGIALGGGRFKVDSRGELTASSGTFTGKVRANQVQTGGDNGYITGGQIGSQTVGVGNMANNSIENRCIQSGSIYNSTINASAAIAKGKLSQEVQNLLADVINANNIFGGTTSADFLAANTGAFGDLSASGTVKISNHVLTLKTISYKDGNNTTKSATFVTTT